MRRYDTMIARPLVQMVWDGSIYPARSSYFRDLQAFMTALVPFHVTVLAIAPGEAEPPAMIEDMQLDDGLSLGDVLAGEIDIDVPQGSVVLLRHEAGMTDPSAAAGRAVAEILFALIDRGIVPMEAEDETLLRVAAETCDACASVLGLNPQLFRDTLGDALRQYWSLQGTGDLFGYGMTEMPFPAHIGEARNDVVASRAGGGDPVSGRTFRAWAGAVKRMKGDCGDVTRVLSRIVT